MKQLLLLILSAIIQLSVNGQVDGFLVQHPERRHEFVGIQSDSIVVISKYIDTSNFNVTRYIVNKVDKQGNLCYSKVISEDTAFYNVVESANTFFVDNETIFLTETRSYYDAPTTISWHANMWYIIDKNFSIVGQYGTNSTIITDLQDIGVYKNNVGYVYCYLPIFNNNKIGFYQLDNWGAPISKKVTTTINPHPITTARLVKMNSGNAIVVTLRSWYTQVGFNTLTNYIIFDSTGNYLTEYTLPELGARRVVAVKEYNNNILVMLHSTNQNLESYTVLLLLSQNFNEVWRYVFPINSHYNSIDIANNNDIILVGSYFVNSTSNSLISKVDAQGNLIWSKTYGSGLFNHVKYTDDQEILASGTSSITGAGLILLADANGCYENCVSDLNDKELESDFTLFPNPAKNVLTIQSQQPFSTIEVTNALGQIDRMDVNSKELNLDISHYTAGIYFIKIYTEDGLTTTKKFVKSN
jgi:hypothetical protein